MSNTLAAAHDTHMSETLAAEPAPKSIVAMLREDIRCVADRDPAARSTFEVMAIYPGIHAIVAHRFAHRLWQRGNRFLARLLAFISRTVTNIDIHPGARIGRRFFIDHGACVVIGETAEIGDDVTLYHGVTLGGTSWNKGKRHPTLEDGVVVGAGAKILGPITVGERARVGANSVVVKEVPPECTVVGVPGHVVGARNRATADADGHLSLDHNLLPDPVARSIQCLLDRIESLEAEVATMRAGDDSVMNEDGTGEDASCRTCSAGDLCCEHEKVLADFSHR